MSLPSFDLVARRTLHPSSTQEYESPATLFRQANQEADKWIGELTSVCHNKDDTSTVLPFASELRGSIRVINLPTTSLRLKNTLDATEDIGKDVRMNTL